MNEKRCNTCAMNARSLLFLSVFQISFRIRAARLQAMKFDRESLRSIQSFLPVQLFIGYCFCVSGLIVNVLQLLTYICIWPFNKELYRRLNYHLGTLIWSREYADVIVALSRISFCSVELTCLYSWWSNSSVTLYGDPEDVRLLQNEYAMVLVNHRYEIDWLTGMVISQRLGLLGVI